MAQQFNLTGSIIPQGFGMSRVGLDSRLDVDRARMDATSDRKRKIATIIAAFGDAASNITRRPANAISSVQGQFAEQDANIEAAEMRRRQVQALYPILGEQGIEMMRAGIPADTAIAMGDKVKSQAAWESFLAENPDIPPEARRFIELNATLGGPPAGLNTYQSMLDAQAEANAPRYDIVDGNLVETVAGQSRSLFAAPDKPEIRTIGKSVLRIDPDNNSVRVLYTEPSDGTGADDTQIQTWMVNGQPRTSPDKGRTYFDTDGQRKNMPVDAYQPSGNVVADVIRTNQAVAGAQERISGLPSPAQPSAGTPAGATGVDLATSAQRGTGLTAKFKSALDQTFGDVAGEGTWFPDVQEARQHLNLVRQMAKDVFLNSNRGAIWEQQRIEELFPNPDPALRNSSTEAAKAPLLVMTLEAQRDSVLRELASGSLAPDEVSDATSFVREMDRVLGMISSRESALPGTGGALPWERQW